MRSRVIVWMATLTVVALASHTEAETIIAEYDAASAGRPNAWADNPVNQGWTADSITESGTWGAGEQNAGPVDVDGDDQGTDSPIAWRIHDQDSRGPKYRQAISDTQLDLMESGGWRLTANIRFATAMYSVGFHVADADWDVDGDGTDGKCYMFRIVSVNPDPNDGSMIIQVGSNTNVDTGIAYDATSFYDVVLQSVAGNPYEYTVEIDGTVLLGTYSPYYYASLSVGEGGLFGSNSGGGTGIMGDVASYRLAAVPEPGSVCLLFTLCLGTVLLWRRPRSGW